MTTTTRESILLNTDSLEVNRGVKRKQQSIFDNKEDIFSSVPRTSYDQQNYGAKIQKPMGASMKTSKENRNEKETQRPENIQQNPPSVPSSSYSRMKGPTLDNKSQFICYKCSRHFSERSSLYQHYSVQHFYNHILKTFKAQERCPLPSCTESIGEEE